MCLPVLKSLRRKAKRAVSVALAAPKKLKTSQTHIKSRPTPAALPVAIPTPEDGLIASPPSLPELIFEPASPTRDSPRCLPLDSSLYTQTEEPHSDVAVQLQASNSALKAKLERQESELVCLRAQDAELQDKISELEDGIYTERQRAFEATRSSRTMKRIVHHICRLIPSDEPALLRVREAVLNGKDAFHALSDSCSLESMTPRFTWAEHLPPINSRPRKHFDISQFATPCDTNGKQRPSSRPSFVNPASSNPDAFPNALNEVRASASDSTIRQAFAAPCRTPFVTPACLDLRSKHDITVDDTAERFSPSNINLKNCGHSTIESPHISNSNLYPVQATRASATFDDTVPPLMNDIHRHGSILGRLGPSNRYGDAPPMGHETDTNAKSLPSVSPKRPFKTTDGNSRTMSKTPSRFSTSTLSPSSWLYEDSVTLVQEDVDDLDYPLEEAPSNDGRLESKNEPSFDSCNTSSASVPRAPKSTRRTRSFLRRLASVEKLIGMSLGSEGSSSSSLSKEDSEGSALDAVATRSASTIEDDLNLLNIRDDKSCTDADVTIVAESTTTLDSDEKALVLEQDDRQEKSSLDEFSSLRLGTSETKSTMLLTTPLGVPGSVPSSMTKSTVSSSASRKWSLSNSSNLLSSNTSASVRGFTTSAGSYIPPSFHRPIRASRTKKENAQPLPLQPRKSTGPLSTSHSLIRAPPARRTPLTPLSAHTTALGSV